VTQIGREAQARSGLRSDDTATSTIAIDQQYPATRAG
jgi:hypothetical protein